MKKFGRTEAQISLIILFVSGNGFLRRNKEVPVPCPRTGPKLVPLDPLHLVEEGNPAEIFQEEGWRVSDYPFKEKVLPWVEIPHPLEEFNGSISFQLIHAGIIQRKREKGV